MATSADDIEVDDVNPESRETITDLSKGDWSQTQVDHHTVHIAAAKTDLPDEKELTPERLTEVQQQLLDAYIGKNKRELIIKRIQHGTFLVKELFEKAAAEKDTPGEQENLAKAKYLEELLLKQCNLVSNILRQVKEMDQKKKKLTELEQRNLALITENREKMETIKQKEESMKKVTEDEETKELMSDLDKTLQKVAIGRHTLQALVIGSGINWAQDPDMEEMVLKLGEQLEL